MTEYPLRLRRADAARYLLDVHGLSRTAGTLAKLAVVGGGPKFRKAGARMALYDRQELDRWAIAILGPQRASTSAAA